MSVAKKDREMSIAERARKLGQAIVKICPVMAYVLVPLLQLVDRLQGGVLHQHVLDNIEIFCTPEQKNNPAYIRALKRDMWYCAVRYVTGFNEYFLYDFPRLSHRARMEFVAEYEKYDMTTQLVNAETQAIFKDKWKAYQHFRPYYKRDIILGGEQLTQEQFNDFIQKHPRFIVKPRAESGGDGIYLCDTQADGQTPQELLARFRQQDVILEELIVQREDMARLHPHSVNTIRCATFYDGSQAHILFSYLRMGRGNNVVDNASAGGFAASFDPETGIIFTPGICKTNLDTVLVHPDSGQQIIGMHLPMWEQAKALVMELVTVVPEQKYVGWDLALTDDGWVMVEGNNTGQMGCPQFTTKRGLRPKIAPYFNL